MAREAVEALQPGATISLRDYAEDVGVPLRTAQADLVAFARARLLLESPGAGGLKFYKPRSVE